VHRSARIAYNVVAALRGGDFHVDAKEIFDTVQNDVQPLLTTIQQMIADLERS